MRAGIVGEITARLPRGLRGDSLRARASRTAGWTVAGYGSSILVRLVSNLVLTRLLAPEVFGLMGLAQLFVSGLQMLTDVGIQVSVVQGRRDDSVYLNTAWTLQVMRGGALFLVSAAVAWPYAVFYGQPALLWVLPLFGLGVTINGLKSASTMTAVRDMRQGMLTMLMTGARVASLVITILWALNKPDIWALVVGGLAYSIMVVLLSHTLLGGPRHRFQFDRAAAAELARVGQWVAVATGLTFLANQSDRLILGKLIDMRAFGVLMVAYALYQMPRELLMAVVGNVLFPAASRRADLPREELRTKILKSRGPFLFGAAVFVAVAAGFGDVLVKLIYDQRYREAMWMLPILMLGLWPRVLDASVHEVLIAIGKLHYNPAGSAARLLLVAAALPVAFHFYGIFGAVVVIAVADIPNYLACVYGQWRCGLLAWKQDMVATCILIGTLGLGLLARTALGMGSPIGTAP